MKRTKFCTSLLSLLLLPTIMLGNIEQNNVKEQLKKK